MDSTKQPISLVARSIVSRRAIAIDSPSQTLLPRFQIDPSTRGIRPGIEAIIKELSGPFDDFEIADWFARPNAWLDGGRSAIRMGTDLHAVFHAARADR